MELGKLRCHRSSLIGLFFFRQLDLACCDWLGVCIITYCAFGPLIGYFGQFFLFIVTLLFFLSCLIGSDVMCQAKPCVRRLGGDQIGNLSGSQGQDLHDACADQNGGLGIQ